MMELNPLDSRARLLFWLQAFSRLLFFWIPASLMVGVGVAWLVSALWGLFAAAALAFLNFVLAVWWPTFAFDRWGWAIRDDELLIARGILIRHVTAIPLSRVQHVDTRQGLLEQWMGLANLQIFTASGLGADGVIPGLSLEGAEALRDQLVKRDFDQDDGV